MSRKARNQKHLDNKICRKRCQRQARGRPGQTNAPIKQRPREAKRKEPGQQGVGRSANTPFSHDDPGSRSANTPLILTMRPLMLEHMCSHVVHMCQQLLDELRIHICIYSRVVYAHFQQQPEHYISVILTHVVAISCNKRLIVAIGVATTCCCCFPFLMQGRKGQQHNACTPNYDYEVVHTMIVHAQQHNACTHNYDYQLCT